MPVTLDSSLYDDCSERDEQTEDQPGVDHLGVRGGGEGLYLAREDRRHHQHDRQVDRHVLSVTSAHELKDMRQEN